VLFLAAPGRLFGSFEISVLVIFLFGISFFF